MWHVGIEISWLFIRKKLLTLKPIKSLCIDIPLFPLKSSLLVLDVTFYCCLDFWVYFAFYKGFVDEFLFIWFLFVLLFLFHLQETLLKHAAEWMLRPQILICDRKGQEIKL